MWLLSWLRFARPGFRRPRSRKAPWRPRCPQQLVTRLYLEPLEDRTLLSGTPVGNSQLAQSYGQLPLSFQPNEGQTAPQVNYLSQGQGYTLFLTPSQAVLALNQGSGSSNPGPAGSSAGSAGSSSGSAEDVLKMQLVGANPAAQAVGQDPQPGVSNYLLGKDPSQWITNVPNYGKVEYQDLYPGINLVYYGNSQTQLEYDFDVAPGANPAAIQLAFQGTQGMSVDGQGNLVLHMAGGNVTEQTPVAYQEIGGVRQAVPVQYALEGNGQVGFQVGAYDPSQPLVIDPVLSYSTYLGGSGGTSIGLGIAVDSSGDAYITGTTTSSTFPTTAGAFQTTLAGTENAFVTELNPSGSALVYSTYVGGSSSDQGTGIAVDSSGDAYITGYSNSSNFPTTPGAFQTTSTTSGGSDDAFVTKLNAGGTALVYSTYLGGSGGSNVGAGIAVDGAGNAYVTGVTNSTSFPTTAGAFQTTNAGAAVGGKDAFVTKLNPSGSAPVYSTYLGGNGSIDGVNGLRGGIALDSSGDAYITGSTSATKFPTTAGAIQTTGGGNVFDAFVTELNATGSAPVYSTYLGGSPPVGTLGDSGTGIAVDSAGNICVTGLTNSGFPTTAGAFERDFLRPQHPARTLFAAAIRCRWCLQPGVAAVAAPASGRAAPTNPRSVNAALGVRRGTSSAAAPFGRPDSSPLAA
jgi:hypothetical protein